MTAKHARLASAVADAMLSKDYSTKHLAAFAGCSSSTISNALSGKYDMREERWRLVCENLGLDYDEIIKDPEPELPPASPCGESTSLEREAQAEPAAETGCTAVLLSEDRQETEEDLPLNDEERSTLAVAARYMAGHLKEDIRKGMDISLEDLYTLMTFCKRMQEAAENGT